MHRYFYFCLAFFWVLGLYSQNTVFVDSLKAELEQDPQDSVKVEILNELAWQLRYYGKYAAKDFAFLALELSELTKNVSHQATALNRLGEIEKLAKNYIESERYFSEALLIERNIDNKFGIGRATNQLAIVNKNLGNFETALEYGNESLIIFTGLNNILAKASTHNVLADIYRRIGDYSNATIHLDKSLEIRRNLDNESQIAYSLTSLGSLNLQMSDYHNAEDYFTQALRIWEVEKNGLEISKSYTNLANVHYYLKDYDKAIRYNKRSLAIKDSLDYKLWKGTNYTNLGVLYSKKREYSKAITYYGMSKKLKIQSKDTIGLIPLFNNIGNLLYKQGNIKEALENYLSGIEYAEDRNAKVALLELYKGATDSHNSLGNYAKGLIYNNRYLSIRDSLDASYKSSVNIQKLLDEERQNSKVLLMDQKFVVSQNQKKNILIYSLIIGLLMVSLLFFLANRTNRLKQKTILAEKREKESEHKLTRLIKDQEIQAMNAMITGQEGERKRIAQDLHDRLGSILSMTKIHFQSIEQNLEQIAAYNKTQYQKANELLDQACEEVRKVAHDLISGVLSKFGLIPALNSLSDKVNNTGQLKLEIITHGFNEERLNYNLEITLYRVIQELLTNVLKHAKAKEMTIQLLRNSEGLSVIVEDDGIGFDPNNIQNIGGLGLKNIEARITNLNGEFTIDSGLGAGTTTTIKIPITE